MASFRADVSFAVIDAFLIVTMYVAAVGIRLIDGSTQDARGLFSFGLIRMLPFIILAHVVANLIFGAYGHMWEFASVAEAKRIVTANLAAVVLVWFMVEAYRAITGSAGPIPRGSIILGGVLTLAATGMVRFRSRLFSFRRGGGFDSRVDDLQRMVVVGVSRLAADTVRRLEAGDPSIDVIGFVTSGGERGKRILAGHDVLGTVDDLTAIIPQYRVGQVLVVGGGEDLARRVLDMCIFNEARLRIVPDLDAVFAGRATALDIRDLEITDLLPRPAIATRLDDVACLIEGRRVLITGAGGSIGAEIVRQVQEFAPEAIFALDHDETHLYDGALRWASNEPTPRQVLCDVRDRRRLGRLVEEIRPAVVFHAAALKHVPILEENPEEATYTNVLGTQNLIDASLAVGVERFVLISTDKAVEPTSVMGASKRIAEMLVQAADQVAPGTFTSVRFGNVLGSRGSVVPTFVQQIKSGGPVTITDPNMTRYFMTVDEAVQLVLQASAIAEPGGVYVLDMSDPVRIADLARRLIRLSGLVPGRDIAIEVTGRRAGEKLTEKLADAPLEETGHTKIHVTRPTVTAAFAPLRVVGQLAALASASDKAAIRSLLMQIAHGTLVPGETDLSRLEVEDLDASIQLSAS